VAPGKALLVLAALNLKAAIGPTYLAATLSIVVYQLCEHGHMQTFPLVSSVLSLVIQPCPPGLQYAYAAVTCLYFGVSSIHDSILHA